LSDAVLPFKGLRQLVLSAVNLKDNDFSPLRQKTSLTLLDLSKNRIKNISFLDSLTNITQFYLGYNQIVDLLPLAELDDLNTLDLQNNHLTRITSLAALYSRQ
jgi:Leucine-rich repeat (LRR) protein